MSNPIILGYLDSPYLRDPYLMNEGIQSVGFQVEAIITKKPVAMQVDADIHGFRQVATQVRGVFPGTKKPVGWSIRRDNIAHWFISGYLERPYLVDPYLTGFVGAQGGWQVKAVIHKGTPVAFQVRSFIHGAKSVAFQVKARIVGSKPIGFQVNSIRVDNVAMQVTGVLYNVENLRVMIDFPSRGLNGLNWLANSTAPGDFGANNLNTDIVEQQWRSAPAVITGLTLDCDGQAGNIFVDTMAILNHNMTTSAVVVFQGSDFADQHIVGVTIPLVVTKQNIIYIAPTLPIQGFRYWRFIINDPTNPDGQVKIGTIVFGAAKILSGDNITDQVSKSRTHFSDKVMTEGFTDVTNDRALKYVVEVNFNKLDYTKGNYALLDDVFARARTSLKCLWVPDPRIPLRFGLFAKMKEIPKEIHNVINRTPTPATAADYVDFTVSLDESL